MGDRSSVEAVYYGTGQLCISTQVGCRVGCPFCLSGAKGFFRNLSHDEMQSQLIAAKDKDLVVQGITLSGIGEPLHNLENVLPFMDDCHRQRMPVSLTTTGSPLENLKKVLLSSHNGVMVSLHAGTPQTHRQLIPGGPSYDDLWESLSQCLHPMSRRKRRKVGINYLLVEGTNDSNRELDRLLALIKPFPELTLHLLTCNPGPCHAFRSPPPSRFNAVYDYLRRAIPNVRRSNHWRRQSQGGCGTLLATSGTNVS